MSSEKINLGAGTLTVTSLETGEEICSCKTDGLELTIDRKDSPPRKRIHTKESIAMGKAFLGTSFKGEIGEEYE